MKPIMNPKSYVYVGPRAIKKIKAVDFPRGVPIPVWDPKTDRLIRSLPYMREAGDPVALAAAPKASDGLPESKSVNVYAEPKAKADNSERDALRLECDAKSIGYDKRWGVDKLREAINYGMRSPVQQMAEAE